MGSAVAEWSKALLERENKRKPKDPRFAPPRPSHLLKVDRTLRLPICPMNWAFSFYATMAIAGLELPNSQLKG